jgi:hypothetical protein
MSIRRGGAILAATFLLMLLPSSAQASPAFVSYVGCSAGADAAPAHACRLGEQLGAFFEVKNRTEVQFQTCIGRFPGQRGACTTEQLATALTPMVLRFTPRNLGSYEVSWRVEGRQVASWALNVVPVERPLTTQAASRALRYKLLAESPAARFLTKGGPLCPRIYRGHVPRSLCFAEYRTGKLHSLVGYAVGGEGDQLSLRYRAEARWFRRWALCPLNDLPGTLSSNNDCGYHQPQNDEDLLRSQALTEIRAGRPLPSVRWTFAESTGFSALGLYRVTRRCGSYLYRNSLGDAFRYRP